MKKNPSPSQQEPKRVLTGQSSNTSKVQALIDQRTQFKESAFQLTKKERKAEKKNQKIKQGFMQEYPPLTLGNIYQGNLQRSNLLQSFNLSRLDIVVLAANRKNKSLCSPDMDKQRKYRIFLHMCVMRAIYFLYNKQCKQSKPQVQKKFFKIMKMFQFILESLLDQQSIYYTQFQLENCQVEVALRWTLIYQAFREFYQQFKKQQISNTEVKELIINKIEVSKLALFSVRKSKIYQHKEAVQAAIQMIKLIKSSKLLATIYKRFVKTVWGVQMELHKILALNWSTQFLFIDFMDEKTQGLTTHNDKFYSFINMLQIVNKIEDEQENEEENQGQKEEDQQQINNQLNNMIKMYVFVVVCHQLAHSLVRKLKIPQIQENDDDSTSGIKESQERGYFFQQFLFGDRVSVVTGQNCQKIQKLLKLKDLSQFQFDSFQKGFSATQEKEKKKVQKDSNEQIAQSNQFNFTIQTLQRNIKLADENLKGTKYEKPIKNMILNETEKLMPSQQQKIKKRQLKIQKKMQKLAINEVANEKKQKEANKLILIQGIEALKKIGNTKEQSLGEDQIFIGMKRQQGFQAKTKMHNAIRGSCIPPKHYMKDFQ